MLPDENTKPLGTANRGAFLCYPICCLIARYNIQTNNAAELIVDSNKTISTTTRFNSAITVSRFTFVKSTLGWGPTEHHAREPPREGAFYTEVFTWRTNRCGPSVRLILLLCRRGPPILLVGDLHKSRPGSLLSPIGPRGQWGEVSMG